MKVRYLNKHLLTQSLIGMHLKLEYFKFYFSVKQGGNIPWQKITLKYLSTLFTCYKIYLICHMRSAHSSIFIFLGKY
jgi:hypothetical protein